MGAVEKLVEFVESEPKTVAVALLGVIASAGIGGALYVSSLRAQIEQFKDAMVIQTSIASDQRVLSTDVLLRQVRVLTEQIFILRDGIGSVRATLDSLDASPESKRGGRASIARDEVVALLRQDLQRTDERVASSALLADALKRVSLPVAAQLDLPPLWTPSFSWIKATALVFLLALGFALGRWRRVSRPDVSRRHLTAVGD